MQANTVVVGASAAGLAVAACLQRKGVPFRLLEQSDGIGCVWRGHYDRLHLHTNRALSGLPFWPMPASYPKYPSRDQVVEYLEAYASELGIEPEFGQQVRSIQRVDGGWLTRTDEAELASKNVIVATGNARRPKLPTFDGQSDFDGDILHSSRYTNGARWRGQRVLVVGFGNSGGEIAIDLVEHGAHPTLAVRSPVNVVPRDLLGIPILAIGIVMAPMPTKLADWLSAPLVGAAIGDIRKLGLRKLPYGPNEQIRKHGRIPLLDIGTVDLIRRGRIDVAPGIRRFTKGGVEFDDGKLAEFAAVVLATGYEPALAELFDAFTGAGAESVFDAHGCPQSSGHEVIPGLYFCGFYVSPKGMLREIGIEAQRIADSIASRH